jgi:hypothetical protein
VTPLADLVSNVILSCFDTDYEGSMRLLEIAQVPSEHAEEFKSGESCLKSLLPWFAKCFQSGSSRSSTQTIFGSISKVPFHSTPFHLLKPTKRSQL